MLALLKPASAYAGTYEDLALMLSRVFVSESSSACDGWTRYVGRKCVASAEVQQKPVLEATRQAGRQPVVVRLRVGLERHDAGAVETGVCIRGNIRRPGRDAVRSVRQRVQFCLRRLCEIGGQEVRSIRLVLPVQSHLRWEVNPTRANIANLRGVVFGKDTLHTQRPCLRIGQLLIRNIGRGRSAL